MSLNPSPGRQVLRARRGACLALALLLCGAAPGAAAGEKYLDEARIYQQKGEYPSAIIQLKNALQQDPNDRAARLLLGEVYLKMGNGAAAEKELRRAMALGADGPGVTALLARAYLLQGQAARVLDEVTPDESLPPQARATLLALRGEAYLVQRQFPQAGTEFERALAVDGESFDAVLGSARLALLEGRRAAAEVRLARAIEIAPRRAETWMLQGDIARLREDAQGAWEAYQRALEHEPGNLSARLGRAAAAVALGRYDEGLADVDNVRAVIALHPVANYLRAVVAFQQRDLPAAKEALQVVLRVIPEHLPSHLMSGAVHYAQGSLGQAETHLVRYLAAVPDALPAIKLLAATRLRGKNAAGAIAALTPALERHPDDAQVLVLLGGAYLQQGDFNRSTEYFERAVAIAPDVAEIRTHLAFSHLAAGETDQAVTDLEAAVDMGEGLIQTELLLVLAHLQRAEFEQALEASRRLGARMPEHPLPHNLRGTAYLGLAKPDAARREFERAVALQPGFAAAELNLARLDLRAGDPQGARRHYEAVLRHDKRHMGAMLALARLAEDAGDGAGALEWLERAKESNPTAIEPGLILVQYRLRRAEGLKALAEARELSNRHPDHPAVLEAIGEAQLMSGETSSAVVSFRRLAELRPKVPQAHFLLARAQRAAGGTTGAAASLRRALELQPDFLPAQALLAEIALAARDAGEAMRIAQEVQRQRPDAATGYVMEGDIHVSSGAFAQAAAGYAAGLQREESAMLALKLHEARKSAGQGEAALEPLEHWLGDHPEDVPVRMVLAVALQSMGQRGAAIAHYRRVLDAQPKNIVALNNIAWLFQEQGDPQGVEYAARAYTLAPERPEITDTYGWLLIHHGDARKGLVLIQQAATQAPHIPEIRYHLGVALHKAGQNAEARKELERLLRSGKTFPGSDAARELLERLQ